MIRIPKRSPVFREGSVRVASGRENVMAYAEQIRTSGLFVIINNSDALEEVTVPVWQGRNPDAWTRMPKRLMYSYHERATQLSTKSI